MTGRGVALTRGEYWLLEAAVETRYPWRYLTWATELREQAMNRTDHGCERDEVVETLAELFARRWLFAEMPDRCWFPDRASCERLLDDAGDRNAPESGRLSWGMTAAGGAVWEEFARPNWGCYVNAFTEWNRRPTAFVCEGESRERLDRICDDACRELVLPWHLVRWDELQPWHATYWKELPKGYRFRIDLPFGVSEHGPRVDLAAERRWYGWRS